MMKPHGVILKKNLKRQALFSYEKDMQGANIGKKIGLTYLNFSMI